MKKQILATFLIVSGIALFGQNQFTISKDTLGGDQVKVTIEHQNGRSAEYLLSEEESAVGVSIINNLISDNSPAGINNDVLETTIQLPSDEYSSSPIQFFNADSILYCFGTHEILVIDQGTGDVTNTIDLFDARNFYVNGLLTRVPVNKFITGDTENSRLYCADATNHLYFIDMSTNAIFATDQMPDISNQLSTSVVVNTNDTILYWMVNSWDGTNGTTIRAYNSITGAFLTQRVFTAQINDMAYENGGLFITYDGDFLKLNPQTLQTTHTHTQVNTNYRIISNLNPSEIAVSFINDTGQWELLQLFSTINLTLQQDFTPDSLKSGGPYFRDIVYFESQIGGNTYQNLYTIYLSGDAFDVFTRLTKIAGTYEIQAFFDINGLFTKNMIINDDNDYIYTGGKDIGKIDLAINSITLNDNLDGCYTNDLAVVDKGVSDDIFSANPIEGTYSLVSSNLINVKTNQTAFKTNSGCYNPTNNKAYFINSQIDYDESGIAIVNCSTNELIDILPLGKYLTQAVYHVSTNKVFVASKKDMEIYVINGQTNQLVSTINFTGLVNHIEQIFNTGDEIVCKAWDKVFLINPSTYTYTTLTLPTGFQSYYCRKMALNESEDELYLMLSDGYTKIVTINLSTSTIDQSYSLTILNGYDMEYNHELDEVYLANLTLPYFYVMDPSDFSIIETIDYTNENLFSTLDIEVDYFRHKAFITCAQDITNTENYLAIIDLDDYSYTYSTLDDVKSALAFNHLNERFFHNKLVENQNGLSEVSFGVNRGYNNDSQDDISSDNLLNRPYSIGRQYDDLKPVVNTESNKIYWPNADFSNISVVDAYTDRLTLQTGWNWLSFPRLERADNDPAEVIPVLSTINYFPNVELELNDQFNGELFWNSPNWTGQLTDVRSTEGYQLDLDILSDDEAPKMNLYGAILDPETPITLNVGETWVGYFLEDGQMPLDAIPAGVLQHVTQIKAQYWTMIHDISGDPEWKYKGNVTPIQYGDMVKISVNQQCTLVWNQPLAAAEEMLALETEYFEFEEQADYLPLFVETDSTSDIQEIAVLANGVVKGAAVRRQSDTLTQVSAYLEGVAPGTPLTFETWEGYKSAPTQKTGYAVYNPARKAWEPRTLYHGEHVNYHVVSLKAVAAEVSSMAAAEVSCTPNPFNSETTFTIRMDQAARVSLTIRDMNGRTVATLLNSRMPEGLFRAKWDGTGSNGTNAGNGVYYYHLSIDGRQQDSGKIVLIR
jgi:hypothetical protein